MAIFNYTQILLIPFLLYLLYCFTRRRGKARPGLTNWPVIGMLPAMLQNLRRGHDYATEVLRECGGTYEVKGPWFWNIDMVFTCDPANIHHVFSKNFSNYPKGTQFQRVFEIIGDGIFNADFELWELHRRTTLSLMTQPSFSSSVELAVSDKIRTGLVPVLDHFCNQGCDFDVQDVFQRFSFDIICKLVLGFDPCSLCVEMPFIPCEKAFGYVTVPLLHRHIIPEPFWKLLSWLNVGGQKKVAEASKAFDEFFYPKITNIQEYNDVLKTFEDVYRHKRVATRGNLVDFLKDTALSLVFAGSDTTSTTLTWFFWLVMMNPTAESKIRQEIQSKLDVKDGRLMMNVEDTGKLVYLHGALCETLRLYPPLALEYKSPVKADVLPSGHYLRPNTKLILSFYSVGRMESVWGEDCMEFKPERWITAAGGIKHEPTYKFPAFNTGPRTCLGKDMAFVQMKMVAATIIHHYNIQLVEGHPVLPRDSIIIHARHGLKVRLSKRN